MCWFLVPLESQSYFFKHSIIDIISFIALLYWNTNKKFVNESWLNDLRDFGIVRYETVDKIFNLIIYHFINLNCAAIACYHEVCFFDWDIMLPLCRFDSWKCVSVGRWTGRR